MIWSLIMIRSDVEVSDVLIVHVYQEVQQK